MDSEKLSEIFQHYGSMTFSWGDYIVEETLEKFFLDEVFESTQCMLGQLHDKTLERFGAIVNAFITHAGINANDSQKLAQMALIYELLWDDVCGCWNDDISDIIRIEYNNEVLVNKPTPELFEEFRADLEKVKEYIPSYEVEDNEDCEWDEDCE
jgi:hypothetical protein